MRRCGEKAKLGRDTIGTALKGDNAAEQLWRLLGHGDAEDGREKMVKRGKQNDDSPRCTYGDEVNGVRLMCERVARRK